MAGTDLSKFSDRVHHGRLTSRLSQHVPDRRIPRVIGMTPRSGVMRDGLHSPTGGGTVRGGPLSPLLSDVVPDEPGKESERRGPEFCRLADDCDIFVSSRKAADRVMSSMSGFVSGRLKLVVNQEKSKEAPAENVRFPGMTIVAGTSAISALSVKRAMAEVRELTPRGTYMTPEGTTERISKRYTGRSGYCRMTRCPNQSRRIEASVRRGLRSRLSGSGREGVIFSAS